MSSYNEQMQNLAKDFQAETGIVSYRLKEVGIWALKTDRWKPGHDAILRQFCDEMSRALREEYSTDPQGRRVRVNHAVRSEGDQGVLWADIYTAPREHMIVAFSQRRDQIITDCAQLKADVDSYNQNQNPGGPIQLRLDFTKDVREYELGREK